mmetsp:Transcript_35595/g.83736  ORF Transcript_35595/g.83736 Transcript_35595/m.83736 type:complete len:371 (-) Transcript_35595:798-1910(-)
MRAAPISCTDPIPAATAPHAPLTHATPAAIVSARPCPRPAATLGAGGDAWGASSSRRRDTVSSLRRATSSSVRSYHCFSSASASASSAANTTLASSSSAAAPRAAVSALSLSNFFFSSFSSISAAAALAQRSISLRCCSARILSSFASCSATFRATSSTLAAAIRAFSSNSSSFSASARSFSASNASTGGGGGTSSSSVVLNTGSSSFSAAASFAARLSTWEDDALVLVGRASTGATWVSTSLTRIFSSATASCTAGSPIALAHALAAATADATVASGDGVSIESDRAAAVGLTVSARIEGVVSNSMAGFAGAAWSGIESGFETDSILVSGFFGFAAGSSPSEYDFRFLSRAFILSLAWTPRSSSIPRSE